MALCVALENFALSLIVVYFHPTSCKTAFLLRAHPSHVRETNAMFPVFLSCRICFWPPHLSLIPKLKVVAVLEIYICILVFNSFLYTVSLVRLMQ